MKQVDADLIARLRSVDSCALSDALDSLGLDGVATGLSQLSAARRIAGEVVSVRLGPADEHAPSRHLCTAAVEAANAHSVIVIAHGGLTDVAGWGGILSRAAVQRGVAGVVIDGAARDLDESRELGLPLYGRAGTPRTARGRIVEKAWNVPVTICGIAVAPADLVLADASGVVFVPRARAEDVVALAERIVNKELRMSVDIEAGRPVSEVMGTKYEMMLQRNR